MGKYAMHGALFFNHSARRSSLAQEPIIDRGNMGQVARYLTCVYLCSGFCYRVSSCRE